LHEVVLECLFFARCLFAKHLRAHQSSFLARWTPRNRVAIILSMINKCNKLLLSVKHRGFIAITMALLLPLAAQAESPPMVVIVPETTLTAPQYQEFYQLAMTHQLVREMPNLLAADLRPVLRYQAYTQTDSERMYWAQVRQSEQFTRHHLQARLELWRGDTLVWSQSRSARRDIRALGPEMRAMGANVLTAYAATGQGLLYRRVLTPESERQIRQELTQSVLFQLLTDMRRLGPTIPMKPMDGENMHRE
jgi:hypothetical protein